MKKKLLRSRAPSLQGSINVLPAKSVSAIWGVIATVFDHYDFQATDPQLHMHAVVSNKTLAVVVLMSVANLRATWGHFNLHAETMRQIMGAAIYDIAGQTLLDWRETTIFAE